MSSRYDERGYGRYGDPEDERTADKPYEREAERGSERGDYGISRRGGYASARGGDYGRDYSYARDYGYGRDYDARDLSPRGYRGRDYGSGEYGSRYGREGLGGGYAGTSRRRDVEDYGRVYGRDRERAYGREDDPDIVRDFDTDYGRTTSRFYGRSGYEYGRDDYDERERAEYGRGGGSWLDRAADQVRSWFGGDEEEPRRARGRGEGKFRGLGPKNYRRSDERVREEVCDRLTDNEWLDASDVEVNVVAGEVILTGTVDSRYAKRLTESIAESVSGISNVQNNLRVQSYEPVAAEAPLAGMDTPLPTPNTTTTPASDITPTSDTTGVNDLGRPSSKAAGQG